MIMPDYLLRLSSAFIVLDLILLPSIKMSL